MIRNQHILVAVLNWGLGHATRSVPIIEKLLTSNNEICIASDGAALSLLKTVFPRLEFLELPGYNIRYPSKNMVWNIGSQLPKIRKAIRQENQLIREWVDQNDTDIIISDNRYGCYHPKLQSIFISHQLNLQTPFAGLINRLHCSLLRPFQEIWIVDNEDRKLSGILSDPKWIGEEVAIKFIGPQSRLSKTIIDKQFDIAVMLSGPEPQRTYYEKELFEQLSNLYLKSILIQGSRTAAPLPSIGQLSILQFAGEQELSQIICGSELIISRPGYSTIMDLAKLGGGALLVPTPGQTEQEYLAKRFEEKQIAQFQKQGSINILKAWKARRSYRGF